jgi:hypothetical protein
MIIPLDITQIFQDKWPELTFYVVLIAIVSVVVWRISAFYYTRIKSLEDKVQHSDCKRHGVAIDSFDASTQTILRKIEFIERVLIAKDSSMLTTFAQSKSPLQLNERAIALMKDSGADKILDEQKENLLAQIEAMKPSSAYDVEETAYKILLLNSGEHWFIPLKDYLFNHPVFQEQPINVDAICFVMSLPLRNYYLDSHSDID